MTDADAAAEAAALALPGLAWPDHASPCHAAPSPALPCVATPSEPDYTSYHRKLSRVLDRMGGLYTLDDILTRIADGTMQSFTHRNSWALTEIQVFPRARQLHVIAIVGDLADVPVLNDEVLKFARRIGVSLVSTYGRRGWLEHGHALGWKLKSKNFVWMKEL
jgi:hypothetical protein